MADGDWEVGDLLGISFPVHLAALRDGGPDFLTTAFRAAGAIDATNSVAAITQLEPFVGGSTGRKALLTVTYQRPDPNLPERLFVKFSRDLDDDRRDRGKRQMASEVRFALLSRIPDFPVAVPRCMFGEYNVDSGSGLLVSELIAFGAGGIEPLHEKARDYEIGDLRDHYDVLITAVARLAGAHRAGRFPAEAMAHFAPPPTKTKRSPRVATNADETRDRVARYADFAARYPQLLPPSIRSAEFIAELREQVPRSIEYAESLRAAQRSGATEFTAFCHWNANIDNAWFWRDEAGVLACGLMDWGNVGQINLVTALASCLTFAEPDFLIEQLDHLLALFCTEFETAGGVSLDPLQLRHQFALHVVSGGLKWPLGAVPLLEHHVDKLATVTDRFDPRIADEEFPRTQLQLLTVYLTLWHHFDARSTIDEALGASS